VRLSGTVGVTVRLVTMVMEAIVIQCLCHTYRSSAVVAAPVSVIMLLRGFVCLLSKQYYTLTRDNIFSFLVLGIVKSRPTNDNSQANETS
jgi:hypothetical protein